MMDAELKKQLVRLAYENPELQERLVPLLKSAGRNMYPTPKEVGKAAEAAAKAVYKLRGKILPNYTVALERSAQDARSTGVSFQGEVASKFADRLQRLKDQASKADWAIMELADSAFALARDLKKVK